LDTYPYFLPKKATNGRFFAENMISCNAEYLADKVTKLAFLLKNILQHVAFIAILWGFVELLKEVTKNVLKRKQTFRGIFKTIFSSFYMKKVIFKRPQDESDYKYEKFEQNERS
jgi:hypothetical protein